MKVIRFLDGPLNGQTKHVDDDCMELSYIIGKSLLPPLYEHTTYTELVPGYWHVVKTELLEMGI